MNRPIPYKAGPFTKGLNNAVAAHLLAPDEASASASCDYSAGSVRGIYGPGTAIATTTTGHNFLMWAGRNAWRSTALGDWGLNDAPTAAGTAISYVTQKTSLTAATNPLRVAGATTTRLGIVPPTASGASSIPGSSASINKGYAVTFVSADGIESNPSPRGIINSNNTPGQIVFQTSSDPQVTIARLYSTLQGAPQGTLYYAGDYTPGATIAATSGDGGTDTTRPLNWGVGGNANSTALPYDHSYAPNLTVLSDAIHAPSPGAGGPGSGIVFGAVGNIIRWSMLGYAFYWPTVNAMPLEETVEALVTAKTTTYAFTDSRVVAFTGFTDTSLSTQEIATQGVLAGCGKTACDTPWGLMWLSREGVVLYAGGEPQVVSRMLKPDALVAGGYTFAAYFDHAYYLFGTADTLVFDMRDFPAIRVTRSSVVATAAHVTPYNPTSGSQGLYVLVGTGIKPWRPIDATGVSGATRQAWAHTSGLLCASQPHGLLRCNRFRPYGTGAVTFTFYLDGVLYHTQAFADLATAGLHRLPGGWGRSLTWKAESTGAGELFGLEIRAEEPHGN